MNKLNWKDHPKRQKKYIENSVNDAGWAKSVIFCANTMRVIDGHGRIEKGVERQWKSLPVDVGYWTKEQGDELLASLDPSTQMATVCLLYTSPSPRDRLKSRMPSSA